MRLVSGMVKISLVPSRYPIADLVGILSTNSSSDWDTSTEPGASEEFFSHPLFIYYIILFSFVFILFFKGRELFRF